MTQHKFLITGTDTEIGKTVVSAMLVQALNADYFKPVQAGLDTDTDTDAIRRLTELPDDHFLPEIYRLETPASPHLAARIDNIKIDTELLVLPESSRTLIVEGAGGVMVPLTDRTLFIDVFQNWAIPVILCARSSLGTINHTLLTIYALRQWFIPIHGVIFVGDEHEENERIIPRLGNVKRLGRVPYLDTLNKQTLQSVFSRHFDMNDFI